MKQKTPSRGILGFYAIGFIAGLGVIYWSSRQLREHQASLHWPVARGNVIECQRVSGRSRSSSDRIAVTYTYLVDGKKHVSNQIALWSADLSSYGAASRVFVERYPTNTPVDVYYNPLKSSEAVIIPGADERGIWLLTSFGVIALATSTLGAISRIRQEKLLHTLLNEPNAENRVIKLEKTKMLKGQKSMLRCAGVAVACLILGVLFLLPPFLTGPTSLVGANATPNWQWIAGGGCLIAMVFFSLLANRYAHAASCPLCKNLLRDPALALRQCDECGTQLLFGGEPPHRKKEATNQPIVVSGVHPSRIFDIAGFMALPMALTCLFDFSDRQLGNGPATVFCVIFALLGFVYYFFPEKPSGDSTKNEIDAETKPFSAYWMEFSAILAPTLSLLGYLLFLVWQHRILQTDELIAILVLFPAGVGLPTYFYYSRSVRAEDKNMPKPPAFVPLTYLATWIIGTFVTVVFLVCLLLKLLAAN